MDSFCLGNPKNFFSMEDLAIQFSVRPGGTDILYILLKLKESGSFFSPVVVCFGEFKEHLDLEMANCVILILLRPVRADYGKHRKWIWLVLERNIGLSVYLHPL